MTKLQQHRQDVDGPAPDIAWLGSLPEKDALLKEFLHDLAEGEYNDVLALAIAEKVC